jgi:hypothetical protein
LCVNGRAYRRRCFMNMHCVLASPKFGIARRGHAGLIGPGAANRMNHDRSPRLPCRAFPTLVTEANTRSVDQRVSPAVLPGPPPPPHRPRHDPQTRAISSIPSPRANRSAACSRSHPSRCCSAGVYPPVAHAACPGDTPTSRPELYEFILVGRSNWLTHSFQWVSKPTLEV